MIMRCISVDTHCRRCGIRRERRLASRRDSGSRDTKRADGGQIDPLNAAATPAGSSRLPTPQTARASLSLHAGFQTNVARFPDLFEQTEQLTTLANRPRRATTKQFSCEPSSRRCRQVGCPIERALFGVPFRSIARPQSCLHLPICHPAKAERNLTCELNA